MKAKVELWTDGSAPATGGPGGYAALLRAIDVETGELLRERVVEGGLVHATHNVAEMTALLEGLRALDRPTSVHVFTDSEYVMKAWTDGWLETWKAKGWPDRIKNRELWRELDAEVQKHSVYFQWVRGHSGVECNERVDRLAGEQTRLAKAAVSGEPIT